MASKRTGRTGRTGKKRKGAVSSYALTPATLALVHPEPKKAKAIAAYLRHGTVSAACAAAGIGRTAWYEWAQQDGLFARLVNEAEEHVTDQLEQEARKRATTGSDTLLIFLLKSKRRAVYGDKVQLTVISPEVVMRVQQQAQLIASRPSWDANELLDALGEIWK